MSEDTYIKQAVHEVGHAAIALALGFEVVAVSVRGGRSGRAWALMRLPTARTIEEARRLMAVSAAGPVAEHLLGHAPAVVVSEFDRASIEDEARRWHGQLAPPETIEAEVAVAIATARQMMTPLMVFKVDSIARELAHWQSQFDAEFPLAGGLAAASMPVASEHPAIEPAQLAGVAQADPGPGQLRAAAG